MCINFGTQVSPVTEWEAPGPCTRRCLSDQCQLLLESAITSRAYWNCSAI